MFLGGYSGFQVTGMIGWGQKSKPKKSLGFPTKAKKVPGPKFNPSSKCHAEFLSLLDSNNTPDTQEHLLFHHLMTSCRMTASDCFEYAKKSVCKSSYQKKYLPNFPTQKIPESKISNSKKSFDHPHHLKSTVPPWTMFNTRYSYFNVLYQFGAMLS